MRQILFFDLPMETKNEQREYTKFLKNIKEHGFYMLQKSVYIKLDIDLRSAEATTCAINKCLPNKGSVIILNVTETQFAKMSVLLGENKTDVINSDQRFIEL